MAQKKYDRASQLADLIGSYIDQPNADDKHGEMGNPTHRLNPSFPEFGRKLKDILGVSFEEGQYDPAQFGETYNPPEYRGIRFLIPQAGQETSRGARVPGYKGLQQEFLGHMITRGYPVYGAEVGQLPGFKKGFKPVGFGER